MRGVEAALIGLVTSATVASMVVYMFYTPVVCPICARDASNVAAWITMMSSNVTDVGEYALEANATIPPRPNDYTAPVAVWVNATPVFYTMGWRP